MEANKPHHNPILEAMAGTDPYANVREKVDEGLKQLIELQRLCYEVFQVSDNGKKLYEIIREKFIIPARFSPTDPSSADLALYWEGFKEAMRGLWDQGCMHKKRIEESR